MNLNSALFPVGIAFTQVYVYVSGFLTFANGRNIAFSHMPLKFFGSTVLDYVPPVFPVNALIVATNTFMPGAIMNTFLQRWSPVQGMKTFGFEIPVIAGIVPTPPMPDIVISEVYLLGHYNNAAFQMTLDTPLAVPGEIVDFSDATETLDALSDIKIYWDTNPDLGEVDSELFPGMTGGVIIPRRYFFIFTDARMRFQIPQDLGIPYGGRRLMVTGVGNGQVFTGEFPLVNLNILLVDGSGLYQLTPGQRHDTYYNRGTTPITEIDLKFPRPGFRTGFF